MTTTDAPLLCIDGIHDTISWEEAREQVTAHILSHNVSRIQLNGRLTLVRVVDAPYEASEEYKAWLASKKPAPAHYIGYIDGVKEFFAELIVP